MKAGTEACLPFGRDVEFRSGLRDGEIEIRNAIYRIPNQYNNLMN